MYELFYKCNFYLELTGEAGYPRKQNTSCRKTHYSCDQCEYIAKQSNALKVHKERKHLGIRYPCDRCDFDAKSVYNLKRHKETKHGDKLGDSKRKAYPCNVCEYLCCKNSLCP